MRARSANQPDRGYQVHRELPSERPPWYPASGEWTNRSAAPKGKLIEHVREIRDDVRQRVSELLGRQGWAKDLARCAPVAETIRR
jgi:hypothetical protein